MLERNTPKPLKPLRALINKAYREDELSRVSDLIKEAELDFLTLSKIQEKAKKLVLQVRNERKKSTGIDSFLTEYALSSEEGIALMCLAEALLRVPDNETIDSLIKDKLSSGDWKSHKGQSESFFVNATTWALMLTGKVLNPEKAESALSKALYTLLNRSGETVVRKAVEKAMRIMSKQFVMGRNIKEALTRAKKKEAKGYRYSYDMLGEAALTAADADRYLEAYKQAITAIGMAANPEDSLYQRPGISIKLSALHPRYQESQKQRVLSELPAKLLSLAQLAKQFGIGLTIDAEESERLDISLDVMEMVFNDDSLDGWNGFGLAVQSYQKRAFFVLDWVSNLARAKGRRMMVRLIKGAYWDSEIKKTQMQGLSEYPVFTRKVFTDVSFQACAKKLLTMTDAIYPQFATHNAYSVAMVLALVGDYRDFEFQCLHGMGNELYEQIVPANQLGIPCRIYAPVGSHEDLLPYLVRRLLENGANSSFVNRIVDESAPIEGLIQNPLEKAGELLEKMNSNIPLPSAIFLPQRKNSKGLDLSDREQVNALMQTYEKMEFGHWEAKPLLASFRDGRHIDKSITSPQKFDIPIGHCVNATEEDIDWALSAASKAFNNWSKKAVQERVDCIERYALLLEENKPLILGMLCLEAGKTFNDAIGELREAIDFCRYYAAMALQLMEKPMELKGYTGEINELTLHARGTILCISPWNFPIAIFTGQVVAALVVGNCVIAKPAEQTPIIATLAVKLLHQAGVPTDVVQILPGPGETIGAALVADRRVKGVVFTGSTQTANVINLALAKRNHEIVPLIAETGGQNAMIVDSSALLEQVVVDVLVSSFGSAGQRCSALRVLYVQEDVYPRLLSLLKGAMAELQIGDPRWLTTDVGPVIDEESLTTLKNHVAAMASKHELIFQCPLTAECGAGFFMPPTVLGIPSISVLEKEVFGPILHLVSYKLKDLDKIIEDISKTGYGLTFGIHSRINHRVEYIREKLPVGNCYVNRNMVGAVVGLQPFGGEGLSGTGPKAGGPYYLLRLCHERTITVDTTAAGGNASLMSIPEG